MHPAHRVVQVHCLICHRHIDSECLALQLPGNRALPFWWRPKDDKALLKGYHSLGGVPWNSRLMLAIADAMLGDATLDFSVKVG